MSSFLDNSKDIILDCVLTDYGRKLLAQGDGSFNIVKFAFGDDEIDYSLFDTASVSTTRDVDIMATPILEAMTNNAASMKSKLLTIATKNQLFLPVMKVQTSKPANNSGSFNFGYNGWVVSVESNFSNAATYNALTASNTPVGTNGILSSKDLSNVIRIDQGFDSSYTDNNTELSPDLMELEYNVMIDSRFGYLVNSSNGRAETSAIDDDMMATYKFTYSPNDSTYVTKVELKNDQKDDSTIAGTRGTKLRFSIRPSDTLTSDSYFSSYGITMGAFKVIKTVVKVVGANTGYSVDIPVAFAKKA